MIRLICALVLLLLPATASAQLSRPGTAPGLDPAIAPLLDPHVPVEVMPAVDLAALEAEDLANEGRRDMPWRYGQPIQVDLDIDSVGLWQTLPSGDQVWRLGIACPGAVSINLAFDQYNLPPGAELYVRSVLDDSVLGAFTEDNNQPHGEFATGLLPGDEIVLEYVEPQGAPFPGELGLAVVTHGYRGVFDFTRAYLDAGPCQNNVACPEAKGWELQIRSVAMITVQNSALCTGVMVNNTRNDGTPYLLSADHCHSNENQLVFWFDWQSPTCANPDPKLDPVPGYNSISGATTRARFDESDFWLMELSSSPPNLYLAGWDYTGSTPQEATCIHHPSADIKKISFENNALSLDDIGYGYDTHWRVANWDDGTTEGGSSGAPIFDGAQRVVGTLTGGYSACTGPTSDNGQPDWFGAFHVHWDEGNNAAERLRDWLDPDNLDPGFVDGFDPTQPVTAHDASIASIDQPIDGSMYCYDPVPAEVTLQNRGSDPLTSVDIQYRVDGGNWSTQAWTGTLATNDNVSVTLPDLNPGAGVHTLEVTVANPNGQPDGNPANDGQTADFEVKGGPGGAIPVSEGFESNTWPPTGWGLASDDSVVWERNTNVGGFGNSSASAWFDNYTEYTGGAWDYLLLPFVDLTAVATPITLEFDVAYARYNQSYWDALAVIVSTDCGQTWTAEYDQSGSALATANDHQQLFEPTSGEWRTDTVDLSGYQGHDNVLVAFANGSGWGNALYLDNIELDGQTNPNDMDGDGFAVADGDCDDTDATVYPGAAEGCNGVDNDCDGAVGPGEVDADGDGVMVCAGDCDDGDAAVYPGATELCNGVDDDCDGSPGADEVDADSDGVRVCDGDCDDGDASIHPGHAELFDGVDNDCDGLFDEGVFPIGGLVITEILQNPLAVSDTAGEWVEVFNDTAVRINLDGAHLTDAGSEDHTIASAVWVDPFTHAVLCRNGNAGLNGGATCDYDYDGFTLDNTSDEVELWLGGDLLDAVAFDDGATFPDPSGASMNLDPGARDHLLNDDGGYWCEATSTFGDGDLGTPGADNDPCGVQSPDDDQDGYTVADGDCDDADPAIHPGATETCNGADDDCDGSIDEGFDGDGDGVTTCAGDCDDGDDTVYPGAVELPDGVDNDCDGSVDEGLIDAGDVVIVEVHVNPLAVSDANGEWIEVANVTGGDVPLQGVTLRDDGGESHLIDSQPPLVVAAGASVVLCRNDNSSVNGGVTCDYDYDGFSLNNSNPDQVVLDLGGTEIDAVRYDGSWPQAAGIAMQLDPTVFGVTLNDDPANWCEATTAFGDGDLGTPGADNDFCGKVSPDADGDGYTVGMGDCDDGDPLVNPGATEDCNQIDDDCDGQIDEGFDVDGDGSTTCAGDCDDGNAAVYPGAVEAADGADNDCDGLIDEDFVGAGDVVISEIHVDPSAVSNANGEWIEVVNVSAATVALNGWVLLDDGGETHTIDSHAPIMVAAGDVAVLCRNADDKANGGVTCVYDYGDDLVLGGTQDDEVVLELLGVEIAAVRYQPGWPFAGGVAMQLDPTMVDEVSNDDVASWCEATSVFGAGDLGTPGQDNDACIPVGDDDVGDDDVGDDDVGDDDVGDDDVGDDDSGDDDSSGDDDTGDDDTGDDDTGDDDTGDDDVGDDDGADDDTGDDDDDADDTGDDDIQAGSGCDCQENQGQTRAAPLALFGLLALAALIRRR